MSRPLIQTPRPNTSTRSWLNLLRKSPIFIALIDTIKITEAIRLNKIIILASFFATLTLIPVDIAFAKSLSSIFESNKYDVLQVNSKVVSTLVLLLLAVAIRVLSNYLSSSIVYNYSISMSKYLIDKIYAQPIDTLSSKDNSFFKSIILTDISNVVGGVIRPLYSLALSQLNVIAISIYLIWLNAPLFLTTIALYLLLNLVIRKFESKHRKLNITDISRSPSQISKRLDEILDNQEIIKLLDADNFVLSRYAFAERSYRNAISKNMFMSLNSKPITELSGFGAILLFLLLTNTDNVQQTLEFAIVLTRIIGPLGVSMSCNKTIGTYSGSSMAFVSEIK